MNDTTLQLDPSPPTADSGTLHRLHRHFAEQLGCRPEDLACGNRQVVSSEHRDDGSAPGPATPLWALRRENGWVISVTPDAYPPAHSLLQALPSNQDPLSETARHRLHETVGQVSPVSFSYAGLQLYTDRALFTPFSAHPARCLTPDDLHLLQSSHHPMAREVERLRAGDLFAVLEAGEVRSFAYLRRLSDEVWEIVVETAAPYRGRGYGKSVVSAATEAVLQRGHIPVYSCDEFNVASRRLAESLGYRTYAEDFVCLSR